ncbi:MAG: hypothetical protein ABIF10_03550 [Candidatus Woesearchaeota archaeon]
MSTYLLRPDIKDLKAVLNTGKVELVPNTLNLDDSIDRMLHIQARHIHLGDLLQPYVRSLRHDIFMFYQKKSGDNFPDKHQFAFLEPKPKPKSILIAPPGSADFGFNLVESLDFQPVCKRIKPYRYAAVKNGKGYFHDVCPLVMGIDPTPNCPANTTPQGHYNPKGNCSYCYASWHNSQPFMSTIFDLSVSSVHESMLEVAARQGIPRGSLVNVRFGQTVESNWPDKLKILVGEPDNLKICLEAMAKFQNEYKVSGAMPTKWPFFDKETIALLKRNKITVLASVGWEECEQGMVLHGSTVENRLEGISRLADEGIPPVLYVMTNIANGRNAWQPDAHKAYNRFLANDKLLLQFLDYKPPKKLAEQTLGSKWYAWEEKGVRSLFGGDLAVAANGRLYPTKIHDDYLKMIGDNTGRIRLCSVHTPTKYCGKCFMDTWE